MDSKNKKRYLKRCLLKYKEVISFLFLIVFLIFGTSYALWQMVLNQTNENRIVTGCLKIIFKEETSAITLNDAVPMTDEEGKKLIPYIFTITNTCSTKAKYFVNLEIVSEGESILDDSVIKANLLKDTNEVFLNNLTSEYENFEKVIQTANGAYMLDNGYIDSNQNISYSLRLWIDNDIYRLKGVEDGIFASKITVTANYLPKRDTNEKILYNIIERQAALDNTSSEFVSRSSGIDFGQPPSDTNGKGVYTIADTKDYYYPVHYFRGAVTNNNVRFANFCWKIVRTTETGGVKLIYNGTPDENGGCTNVTGNDTKIKASMFSENSTSPVDASYMYKKRYPYSSKMAGSSYWYQYVKKELFTKSSLETSKYYYSTAVTYDNANDIYVLNNKEKYLWSVNYNSLIGKYTCFKESEDGCREVSYLIDAGEGNAKYVTMNSGETYDDLIAKANNVKWKYGNDVEYKDGKYNLLDVNEYSPMSFENDYKTGFNAHRYTCFSSENTCSSVNYLYYENNFVTLQDGKNIDDVLIEMTSESTNDISSFIKDEIDDWYRENMILFESNLEDTIWCNDRSIYQKGGWDKDSITNDLLYFNGRQRNEILHKPSILCLNKNDRFTVKIENGNGKLTYPIALLTADEVTLAGHGNYGFSKDSYLYTGQSWWVLTPYSFDKDSAFNYSVGSDSNLFNNYVYYTYDIRPSVSLASGILVSSGNGTAKFPYQLVNLGK